MTIRIGYEIEFVTHNYRNEVREDFVRTLGLPTYEHDWHDYNYRKWAFTDDSSVRGTGNCRVSHELISPVMPLERGLRNLRKVFQWMEDRGHRTTASCGFHVGVSDSSAPKMKKLDLNKLVVLFDEARILENFGRSSNRFCQPHSKFFKQEAYLQDVILVDGTTAKAISANYDDWSDGPGAGETFFSGDKYMSVNIGKILEGEGKYVEFRAMGGKDYHKKFQLISASIRHYARVFQWACSPTAKKEEYARKMKKLVKTLPSSRRNRRY